VAGYGGGLRDLLWGGRHITNAGRRDIAALVAAG
jgi:hypothetical protein